MATPHLAAEPGEIAPDVLLPGDPRRARRMAAALLDAPRLVTEVRGIEGWTGTHDGRPVTFLASGMGVPSVCIYATELYRFYGVERIVRIGSCGGLPPTGIGDLIAVQAAHTDSAVNRRRLPGIDFAAVPDHGLLTALVDAATTLRLGLHVGTVLTSDSFYPVGAAAGSVAKDLSDLGVLGIEMEAAGLFGVAAQHRRRAAALLTVTDDVGTGAGMTAEQREAELLSMAQVGLLALSNSP